MQGKDTKPNSNSSYKHINAVIRTDVVQAVAG